MFGISLFYYYITTASLLCQYLLKNLFKNYFSRKYRYIKAFRDSLFFVEKNFLGFFLFFFWAFASARKKGRRKAGESGRRKGHAGKILRPTAGRGKYTEQLPKKRKDRKEETKKIGSRIPQKGEGRKARGKYHMSGGMRQLSMSKGKLGRNCQPFAICRFTLQRESSGSVKGKSFTYILSTAFR